MKETYWGYWLVVLGIFVIGVMLLVNNISTTNTQDYYNIKEVTQSSMIDAVDFSYYRLYGNLKISEQKFVENFIRRFAENVNMASEYDIDFYDLYEVPPKVSVKISTGTRSFNVGKSSNNSYDVVTTISQILEIDPKSTGKTGEWAKEKLSGCSIWPTTKLWRYLRGETVDGKSMNSESLITLTEEQKSELAKVKVLKHSYEQNVGHVEYDPSEPSFNQWFLHQFTIGGKTVREYFRYQVSAENLDPVVKLLIARGWIEKEFDGSEIHEASKGKLD